MKTRKNRTVPFLFSLAIVLMIALAVIASAGEKGDSGKGEVQGGQTGNNKYYSITDEMMCRGVRIKSVANCPFERKYLLWQLGCEQRISIGEKLLDDMPGNTILWGCIQDRKSSKYHIVIDFYSGGNCWTCEWTDVYDLRGNLVISDKMDMAKCTLPRRRETTPEGFYDEFAGCPEELIKKREINIKKIKKLKQNNEKKMQGINFDFKEE